MVPTKTQARLDYMHWFVAEHYARRDFEVIRRGSWSKTAHALVERAHRQRCLTMDWQFDSFVIGLTDLTTDAPTRTEDWFVCGWHQYHDALPVWERWRACEWLAAEAEYHRIVAEAALRSYGVLVIA